MTSRYFRQATLRRHELYPKFQSCPVEYRQCGKMYFVALITRVFKTCFIPCIATFVFVLCLGLSSCGMKGPLELPPVESPDSRAAIAG